MYHLSFQRVFQALYYGWEHASELAEKNKNHSRLWYYHDILFYFFKYGVGSQRYIMFHFDQMSKEEKVEAGKLFYEKVFAGRKERHDMRNFIAKWSDIKYQTSRRRVMRRNAAYRKYFGAGEGLYVEHGVQISSYHHRLGKLKIAPHVILARSVDLDITGGLSIGEKTSISEGAKVLTHAHDSQYKFMVESDDIHKFDVNKGCTETPLEIGDHVWVGTRSLIMPGVKKIGRFATIGAGAVVEHEVPPYAIVKGNPAKVIWFRCSPETAAKYEEAHYPLEERIPYEVLKANYEKYFNRERRKEIVEWMKF